MGSSILRGLNLLALAAALSGAPGPAAALWPAWAALGGWLGLCLLADRLGWPRHPRWGRTLRRMQLCADLAVICWAIDWAGLWGSEAFLFALLPAALLGLHEGPKAAAALGAAGALLVALGSGDSLAGRPLLLRAAALSLLPWAVAWQARELRDGAGGRAGQTVSFLRSAQISEFLSFVLYQLREYLISVTAVVESLALSIPREQPELAQRAERLKRLVGELNGKAGRLLGDQAGVVTGRVSQHSVFDLNGLVEAAVVEARAAFVAAPVRWRLTSAAGPATVRGDHRGLRCALLSVLQNAAEACGAKGRGMVTVLLQKHGERFHLMISDDGPGLGSRSPDRIFEPLYSARAGSPGLGLGLSMSRRIIERGGGTLDIHSRAGLTSALISLPADGSLPFVRNEESTWAGRRAAA